MCGSCWWWCWCHRPRKADEGEEFGSVPICCTHRSATVSIHLCLGRRCKSNARPFKQKCSTALYWKPAVLDFFLFDASPGIFPTPAPIATYLDTLASSPLPDCTPPPQLQTSQHDLHHRLPMRAAWWRQQQRRRGKVTSAGRILVHGALVWRGTRGGWTGHLRRTQLERTGGASGGTK
ncbi:hypothetical protein BKA80DRAFT_122962 [Phyllosticta citrichinensis]